jgi:hypothetical protein
MTFTEKLFTVVISKLAGAIAIKHFYGRTLCIFALSWSVCPLQAFPEFVGKAGAYQVKHLTGAPLYGRLLALSTNTVLSWKGLQGTNTLAYYKNS